MILIDRWMKILDYLKEKKFATVEEMMESFGVSRSTLRRDLIAMEERGHIRRTRGGAEIVEQNDIGEYCNIEGIFSYKKEEKIKIAKKAAEIIRDNDVIFIDSGSTCYFMIDYICAKNITVVTNGILHIQRLMEKGIKTYILGGYAKPELNLIEGEDIVKKINDMNFDISFLGTMGIDTKGGFTTDMLSDGQVKKAVIASSDKCYVLADASKFNIRRFYTYGEFSQATVITEFKLDFEDKNLNVIYVS